MSPTMIANALPVSPATAQPAQSAQSSADTSDASAPQFAAALSAAHKSTTDTGSTSAQASGTAADKEADKEADKTPAHDAADPDGQSDLAVLNAPLPGGKAIVAGSGLRPVGTGLPGARRPRFEPQDASAAATAALANGGVLPNTLTPLVTAAAAVAAAAPPTGTGTAPGAAAVTGTSGVTAGAATDPAVAAQTGVSTIADGGAAASGAQSAATTAINGPHPTALAPTATAGANAGAATHPPAGIAATTAAATASAPGTSRSADRDPARAEVHAASFATAHTDAAAAAAAAQNTAQPASTTPVTPAAATTAPTATAGTWASAQPELAQSLAHLSTRANGEHEMTVALHPAELGAVHVRALMHDGVLTVTIACADESARAAVTAALPDLHNQLTDLKGLDLQLQGGQADGRSAGNAQAQGGDGSSNRRDSDDAPAQPRTAAADRIDATGSVVSSTTVRRTGGRNDGIDRWM